MAKVTVIITTYNRAHVLPRAMRSILGQTFQDFDILVVDDGSTDDTEAVIRSFPADRVTYVRHGSNRGRGAARNTGVTLAKGDYIAFQDSDDESAPERLEKELDIFSAADEKLGIVFSDMIRISKDGSKKLIKAPRLSPRDGFLYKRALRYGLFRVGTGTSMIRKSCFSIVGNFDEALTHYEDLDFFIRISRHYFFKRLTEPLINYYEEDRKDTVNINSRISSCLHMMKKYDYDLTRDPKAMSRHLRKVASLYLTLDPREAREYSRKAVLNDPWDPANYAVFLLAASGIKLPAR